MFANKRISTRRGASNTSGLVIAVAISGVLLSLLFSGLFLWFVPVPYYAFVVLASTQYLVLVIAPQFIFPRHLSMTQTWPAARVSIGILMEMFAIGAAYGLVLQFIEVLPRNEARFMSDGIAAVLFCGIGSVHAATVPFAIAFFILLATRLVRKSRRTRLP